MTCNLLKNERIDDLHCKGYRIIQNPDSFCFGMDAVLLADFVKMKPGGCALDMGTGTGIIPILLEEKTKGEHFTGLEIQEESADMARRSVLMNGQGEKIDIVLGDIKTASSIFPLSYFDVVTCNPPYMNDLHGIKNKNMPKTIARHEVLCSLEDVIREASRVLTPGGSFFMVHRPFRMAEIIGELLKYKLEPKRIRMVHSYVDKEPTMLLVEAVRGAKSMVRVEPPLIIYKEKGVYSDEIYDIYGYEREGIV